MLPTTGLLVGTLPFQSDDVDEKTFGEAVFTHDLSGLAPPFGGEFEAPISYSDRKSVV